MGSLETMLRKYYVSKYASYFLLQRTAQSKLRFSTKAHETSKEGIL